MQLKILRLQAGFNTQKDLAHALNVSRATVCMWERGLSKPPSRILKKLANVLNCTLDDLL